MTVYTSKLEPLDNWKISWNFYSKELHMMNLISDLVSSLCSVTGWHFTSSASRFQIRLFFPKIILDSLRWGSRCCKGHYFFQIVRSRSSRLKWISEWLGSGGSSSYVTFAFNRAEAAAAFESEATLNRTTFTLRHEQIWYVKWISSNYRKTIWLCGFEMCLKMLRLWANSMYTRGCAV